MKILAGNLYSSKWLVHTLVITGLSVQAACAGESTVEIISHRGESADAPENTLAAFRLAWERKVGAIELDVHLSKDGTAVLIHDYDTKRTTGVKKVVAETPFDELRTLDAGSWKDARFAGEKLPSLEEALATIPEFGTCFIEVKCGPEIVPALVKAVRASGKPAKQLVIISFKADVIAECKRQLPELQAYYLSDFKADKETGELKPTIDELLATAKRINADGLDLSFKGPIDAEYVQKLKAAGMKKVYVWTVDDLEVAKRMVAAGVDGITTNKGGWLQEQLQTK